jgi:HAE1 family hydrophobic/amphiphilic exporter-1
VHFLAVLSMKNRALIALVTIVAAVFGGIALTNLKQELIPSIEFPELIIATTYPGASPEVVSNDVSTPIEQAIQSVPDLSTTAATSSTNSSVVTAQFNYGTDLDTASQKVQSAINQITSALPANLNPQVLTASTDSLPVVALAVTSKQNNQQLSADISRLVIPEINKVDGVGAASLIGQVGQRVSITPDAAKLAAAGLSSSSITQALQQNGVLQGAGSVTENGKTLSVQAGSQITSVDQIASLPLIPSPSASSGASSAASSSAAAAGLSAAGASSAASGAGGADSSGADSSGAAAAAQPAPIRTIGEVASVALTDNPITSYSRVNGHNALTVSVTKLPSANTVDVSHAVDALVPQLEQKLGHGAKFTTVFDQAPFIVQSIDSLTEEGLLGLVMAVIVILIFLLSIRSTLVTAISIPTSVLITFIAMWGSGYTLNIITLGGLTIAIGRVVDDSIVVIENIKRHMVAGADRAKTVIDAVREVAGAVTASTITTVAVFLPVAFVGGEVGELFRPFAVTVTIALLSSLLVALTIVPVLAYWFLRPPRPGKARAENAATDDAASHMSIGEAVASGHDELEHPSRLQKGYLPIITWTLKHSAVTIVIAVVVLVGTLGLVPLMQTNFLGSSGQNTLSVSQTFAPGTSLQTQYDSALVVEKKLLAVTGVKTVQLSVGSSGSALEDAFAGGGNGATFNITTDENADQTALQNTVQKRLDGIKGEGSLTVSASAGLGSSSNLEVDITATSQSDLTKATDAVLAKVKKLSSVNQVTSNISPTLPYIAVEVSRSQAAQYGLSEVAVGSQVSAAMQPTQVGTVQIDDNSLNIYLDDSTAPTTVAALQSLPIQTAKGPQPLSALATVAQTDGPVSVTTQKGLPSSTVTATPTTQNLATANAQVSKAIADADLPSGTTAVLGGVTSDQSSAFSQLLLAMLAAILIVYVVMVATFKSLRQPLMLLISVPFAATGAIVLQLISGIPLGVASLIGVLMLIGIVVTNAIVLVDLINQYRRRGLAVPDAVRHGASRRLRPILMTAAATIFALLPMAVGLTGHGGFISQPLAIVVIGGLVSSTILTLVVLPTLYNLVEGARARRQAKKARRAQRRAEGTAAESGAAGSGAAASAEAGVVNAEADTAAMEDIAAGNSSTASTVSANTVSANTASARTVPATAVAAGSTATVASSGDAAGARTAPRDDHRAAVTAAENAVMEAAGVGVDPLADTAPAAGSVSAGPMSAGPVSAGIQDEESDHHGIHVGRPGEGMPREHHTPTHRRDGDPEPTTA